MSEISQGPGWWQASDGKWYPPEQAPASPTAPPPGPAPAPPVAAPGYGTPPGYPPSGPGYGPPPGAPPYGYGYPAPGYGPVRTNGMAIASLVCALVSIFFGLGAILAIVFGFVARSQIRRSQGTQKGNGLALAGLIIGFIEVAVVVVIVVIAVTHNSSGS